MKLFHAQTCHEHVQTCNIHALNENSYKELQCQIMSYKFLIQKNILRIIKCTKI